MASLNTAANVTSGVISPAIKNRFYEETFLHVATPALVHKQLGQMNTNVPSGQGGFGTGVIYWTRFVNLPVVSAGQGEGFPTTAVPLTAVNVTGTTAQYDAAVSISDLVMYTSLGDMKKQAVMRLGENAGKSIDNVVRDALKASLTAQQGAAAASISAIPNTATLSITEIRRAKRTLSRNDAMPADGRYWVAVAHPDSIYDLSADSAAGGWINANQYAGERGDSNRLFSGEVGRLLGVRFLETSNAAVSATSSITGSGTVYVTTVVGKEAFGVTNLQDLQIIIHDFGSGGIADPTNKQMTAGWKTTFGVAVLNSAFGVNINHMVSSTA